MASKAWFWTKLLVGLLFFIIVFRCTTSMNGGPDRLGAANEVPKAVAQLSAVEVDACKKTIDAKRAQYASLLDAKRYWDAALALEDCPNVLKDKALIDMQVGARRLHHITTAGDGNAPIDSRLTSIQALKNFHPADAVQFETVRVKLQSQADARDAAAAKKADLALKAAKRKAGVSIGMTKDDVLASSWGKPQSINTSTYSFGVHEQWVYGGHNYLYFENGILKSIQN